MTYGTQIRRAREAKRLTQEQLAEALDVSRQAVSKWEMDLSRPAREKLERLSEALDLPPEVWADIDAEQAAVPPGSDARPWKIAAAALGVLCLILAVALAAALRPEPAVPPHTETEPAAPLPAAGDPFPERLALEAYHDYDFGDCPYGTYDRELLPLLDDPEELVENTLWEGVFQEAEGDTPGQRKSRSLRSPPAPVSC